MSSSPQREGPQAIIQAREIVVSGRVQGVGYRPFVFLTAERLGLTGTVLNGSGKVFIHAQGRAECLDQLEHELVHGAPPLARAQLESSRAAEWKDLDDFVILASDTTQDAEIHLPPDLFTCDDCLDELTTPSERRYGYPFINCTNCGPRYTIIRGMPYDRPNTAMAGFPLCADCSAEYSSPRDRRFHAQPLACPVCGPHLEFVQNGQVLAAGSDPDASALEAAVSALREGDVLAVKGVGGYHLVCDASNDEAVERLRQRKQRPHKPLAVMFPMRGRDGLAAVREELQLDHVSASALLDPSRPIVLIRKKTHGALSHRIAPGFRELGAFLPYSPLHHQLLALYDGPLVATSGNISGEPVITEPQEASARLESIADAFVHHNRPIIRPADDPVVRPMAGKVRAIRLGRGTAPLERQLARPMEVPTLALGGHMKVTVALAWEDRVVISPHIGDLDSPRSLAVFDRVIADLQAIYSMRACRVVCDLHPDYASTRWARQQGLPVHAVQHHEAHASALAGEHPDITDWLVFTWDGVGLGHDGQLWGGEALAGQVGGWDRVGSFRPFRLVGGNRAGREPWRSAAALMWDQGLEWRADWPGLDLARQAWEKEVGSSTTSAAGRLFDAAAAILLGRHQVSFEGQGPMELEQACEDLSEPLELPLYTDQAGVVRSDWGPLLPMLNDHSVAVGKRAEVFHASMARALVDQARRIYQHRPFQAVGLSGGVFQNRYLTERVLEGLQQAGFEGRLHQHIPANDGGLSFGQIVQCQAVDWPRQEISGHEHNG